MYKVSGLVMPIGARSDFAFMEERGAQLVVWWTAKNLGLSLG